MAIDDIFHEFSRRSPQLIIFLSRWCLNIDEIYYWWGCRLSSRHINTFQRVNFPHFISQCRVSFASPPITVRIMAKLISLVIGLAIIFYTVILYRHCRHVIRAVDFIDSAHIIYLMYFRSKASWSSREDVYHTFTCFTQLDWAFYGFISATTSRYFCGRTSRRRQAVTSQCLRYVFQTLSRLPHCTVADIIRYNYFISRHIPLLMLIAISRFLMPPLLMTPCHFYLYFLP